MLEIPYKPDLLLAVPLCEYCHAKIFYQEPKGFCYSDGTILLVSNVVLEKLYEFFTSSLSNAVEFYKYVWTYNNTFSFTSFGVKYDEDLCKRDRGIYTFRVQGQVYHYIKELIPSDGHPSYLQLYFYDSNHEIDNRIHISDRLNLEILSQLIHLLEINPYCSFFLSLKNISNVKDHRVVIRSDSGLDQHIYNAPSSSQVSTIWLENEQTGYCTEHDIIVYSHSGFSHKV